MSAPAAIAAQPHSLLRHLLAWTLGALVLTWASFLVAGYRAGLHEADELTDGHLASVAALVLAGGSRGWQAPPDDEAPPPPPSHEYQRTISLVLWDAQGRLLAHSGPAPLPAFSREEGFATLALGSPPRPWRSFARWSDDGADAAARQRVLVLIDDADRVSLAWDIAGQVAAPGLWLLPALALVLGLAVRRGLRPLRALGDDVRALDVQQAGGLRDAHPAQEFTAVVDAINQLVARYHAALQNERELASELAHELRTPLSSLVLRSRALREAEGPPDRAALARLERDALHAGEVLGQLLALARASHAALAEAAQPVDLEALARRVLADAAPAALAAGHELALDSAGPCRVDGHPLLLELALRNLVENAVAHTPPGTLVELRLDAARRTLLVCDGPLPPGAGSPAAAAPGRPAVPVGALGLGLGHRVVAKVAAVHGARFDQPPPPPGFSRCDRLQFAPAPAGGAPPGSEAERISIVTERRAPSRPI